MLWILVPLFFIGAFFLLYFLRNHVLIIALAAGAWIGLPFYNQWMNSSCDGGCDIRVDLLLTGPLFLLVTYLGIKEALRRWRAK